MDRKDFMIVALIGFILAVTLYPQVTSSSSEYDPWLDINDDGKIRIDDILPVALAFGSDGDPTKNVTVLNAYYIDLETYDAVNPGYTIWHLLQDIEGYSRVTLAIQTFYTDFQIDVYFYINGIIAAFELDSFTLYADTATYRVFDSLGEYIRIRAINVGGVVGSIRFVAIVTA